MKVIEVTVGDSTISFPERDLDEFLARLMDLSKSRSHLSQIRETTSGYVSYRDCVDAFIDLYAGKKLSRRVGLLWSALFRIVVTGAVPLDAHCTMCNGTVTSSRTDCSHGWGGTPGLQVVEFGIESLKTNHHELAGIRNRNFGPTTHADLELLMLALPD